MKYKVQIEIDEDDIKLRVPVDGEQVLQLVEEASAPGALVKYTALSQEQQEHLGSLFFLLSNGVINDQVQTSLNEGNLDIASTVWNKHEEEKSINSFLNEDVISPHEVLASNPAYRSYSGPLNKPEKIRLDYREIDLKNKAVYDANDGEENGNFFGFEKIYVFNTNIRLTKDIVNLIIPIDGVEIVQPLSRHKMLIAFGELFEDEEIKFEIHKAIDAYFEML